MRQLTAYASYFDNLGALLIGRARFYNLDGSDAVAYGLDNGTEQYVSLGNMVYTNSSGQLEPQVFLDDHDYLVVFDKYIGGGTMAEDDDPESWEEQGSAVDRYNTLGVELSGGSMRAIYTMDDLREAEPLADDEVVVLLGYNSAGDKEPIYYRWNKFSTGQDNGGSVIKSNDVDQGRWVFIHCPEYLDVRHFGAFPLQEIADDSEQRYAIQNAYDYASGMRCGIHFPATSVSRYYDVSGLTIIGVSSHTDARVFCKTGMSSEFSRIKSIHCKDDTGFTGTITLSDEEVRTSWGSTSTSVVYNPSLRLIMDSPVSSTNKTWTGVQVEILVYTTGCTFDGCGITSFGKIDDYVTLDNCEVETSWFSDTYDWSMLTMHGCTILLRNCRDANTYVTLKNMQYDPDYGDLGEQTLADIQLLAGCVVENAMFNNVGLRGSSEMRNVSGTLYLKGSSTVHNWVDCWVEVTGTDDELQSLQFRRGSLVCSTGIGCSAASFLEDVTVECSLYCNASLSLYRCTVRGEVSAYDLSVTGCDISNSLVALCNDNTLSCKVQCNRFLTGGYLEVWPNGYSGTIALSISVTGNYSDHDFWHDSQWALVTHATTGKIVYEGNYGGCPGNTAYDAEMLTFSMQVPDMAWGDDTHIKDMPLDQPDNTLWLIYDNRAASGDYQLQFWLAAKVMHQHDLDTLGIWRCKGLNYNRDVVVRQTVSADFLADAGDQPVFSFTMRPTVLQAGPSTVPVTEHGTFTRQDVAGTTFKDDNGQWHYSRLQEILSNDGMPQAAASVEWDYRVV